MKDFLKGLKILPRWIIILIDLSILLISAVLGYSLRFNFEMAELYKMQTGLLSFMLVSAVSLFSFQTYAGIIRYTSLQDGIRVLYTSGVLLILQTAVNLFSHYVLDTGFLVPFSVLFIAFFISSVLLFGYRLGVKYFFAKYASSMPKAANVLIFGAGSLGQMAKNVIDHHAFSRFRVVGFMDDDPNKYGKTFGGIKIYSAKKNDLGDLLRRFKVRELVIAISNIDLDRKNAIVDTCLANDVLVRQVPTAEKWVRGELSIKQIKELRIEDLLGRETIKLNNIRVRNDIFNKVICVTGAAGSIGSEIVRQVAMYKPRRLVLIDQSESGIYDVERELTSKSEFLDIDSYIADVVNFDRMDQIFDATNPDMVFHAAAYKHVPLMEQNPSEAVICNVFGTKNLADLAVKYDIEKFVMISTDKAVNPTNIMGATKRLAEIYVQSLGYHLAKTDTSTKFITTRFGNVLGSNGSVIPLFKKQISSGGPITVTHPEVTRYFMTIPEACELVLEAGVMGKGNEIFIFDMGQSVRIIDLARKMIKLSGLTEGKDVQIKITGLREGEKLYEELLNDDENTIPTHHNKIMIANVRVYKYEDICKQIEHIITAANGRSDLEMVALIKKLIPEYKSTYSRFQVLDDM